ncbi:hypothetical protein G647_01480 [Cladophialophora carrionii CBS 160.54]|uniref:Uncharacterized protein n=1 Tax=Cladophialophora carrionii CBS 160.54 TaxID=1279043 RepID=V9DST1_9EURO|nr:uncharacterized protein G647_01480 [Cladophialophora carrionii CBS 160.54]ETI29027.1 hypothetical protein G647_01480 [Cladophialophora carrionii CBS 160.54]
MPSLQILVFHLFYLYVAFHYRALNSSPSNASVCPPFCPYQDTAFGSPPTTSDPLAASDPIVPLCGRCNYETWAPDFEVAAQRRGFRNLYTGEEQIKEAPNPPQHESEVERAKSAFHGIILALPIRVRRLGVGMGGTTPPH